MHVHVQLKLSCKSLLDVWYAVLHRDMKHMGSLESMKFGEHERCVRVARGIAKSNFSFLSALQTSQVLHISMNTQLMYEPIVL